MLINEKRLFGLSLGTPFSRRVFVLGYWMAVAFLLILLSWFLVYPQATSKMYWVGGSIVILFLMGIPNILGGTTRTGPVILFERKPLRTSMRADILPCDTQASRPALFDKYMSWLSSFKNLTEPEMHLRDSVHYQAYRQLRSILFCAPAFYVFILVMDVPTLNRLFLIFIIFLTTAARSIPQTIVLWTSKFDEN